MAIDMTTITSIGGATTNILVIVFALIFLFAIGGFLYVVIQRRRRYSEFHCHIWDKQGHLSYDRAGIFVDKKTNNKRLFLEKANVGLSPDNVPYKQHRNEKVVYLLQTGLKNFQYITAETQGEFKITVTEEDVNWAINAYDRQKKLFNQSLLMQYMPFILLAFVSIIILIIFIYFFKEFKTLREFAVVMKETAQTLAQAKSGTVVIQ